MKFSIFTLGAASLAFFSQVAFAVPNPQGGLPIFICGGDQDIQCPTGFHCCPPLPSASGDGVGHTLSKILSISYHIEYFSI
ncbi:hypothetical protein BDZ97DRAFT_2078465 [Flammula alnicola]|nr:hypothetical protein BDZ97DRAFT_2078465 [Flammula alnicola]